MNKAILTIAILFAVIINVNAQNKFSLGVNGGLSIPVTELANVYKITPSAEFNMGYRISPDIELLLTAGYSKFNFRNESLNDDLHQFGFNYNMNDAWTTTVIPVTAGIRYKFDPITKTILPYGTAEIGAYFTNSDKLLGGTINLSGTNTVTLSATKESQVGLGLALGVGTYFELSKRISLDVAVKYNFVKADFVKDYVITKDTLVPSNVAGINTGMYLTTRAGISIKLY
jgi:opacity protein-like surface antigen